MVMKARADMAEDFSVELEWGSSLQEFLLVKQSEGFTDGTIKTYKSVISRFSSFCISQGINSPENASKKLLRLYIKQLAESYAPNYVNNHICKIRGFYDFLCTEEYIGEDSDPTKRVKMLPKQQKIIVVYSDKEVADLIKVAGEQKNKFHAERDKLLIMLMADCGLRVNEMVTLLDCNVTSTDLLVHKAKGRKQRMLYVTPQVAQQIVKYKRVRDSYFSAKNVKQNGRLFLNFRGENLRNDGVEKMLKRLGNRIELRDTVRNSPHTLRHWFAQSQLNNGVSIYTLSRLLGHESLTTTQLYLKGIADEQLIQSAIETSPLLNMKK